MLSLLLWKSIFSGQIQKLRYSYLIKSAGRWLKTAREHSVCNLPLTWWLDLDLSFSLLPCIPYARMTLLPYATADPLSATLGKADSTLKSHILSFSGSLFLLLLVLKSWHKCHFTMHLIVCRYVPSESLFQNEISINRSNAYYNSVCLYLSLGHNRTWYH